MADRSKHPNKDIEAAIKYAEELGWEYRASGNSSHAWGVSGGANPRKYGAH
jgi:hypothetical protein